MDVPGNIITVLGTLGGAVLGAWLASGRAHKEKLWDLRRQAYGTILSELAMAERILRYTDGMFAGGELIYYGSEVHSSHQDQIGTHLSAARRRFADDYLVLSEEFIALFETFELEGDAEDPGDNVQEEHDKFAELVRTSRLRMLDQARSELKAKRRWQLPFGRST